MGRICSAVAIAVAVGGAELASAPASMAATSGLVAAYGFDEGSGTTVTDASGNGNNGTITNATWAATGKYGKALQFNGTSALVTIPDAASLHLSTGMTLEAWVNPSTVTSTWRDVIYKGNDNYYLEATSTNASSPDAGMIAGGSYADAFGTAALPANTWSYLTETYDGSTLRLYVNGTQVASTAHTGTIATSTNPLQIGGDSIYGQFFAGLIDDVRVYNVALTAAQIQTDMTTPVTAAPDTTPPTQPGTLTATAVSGQRGRPVLGCLHRQRRGHRLPGRALLGRRLHELRPDRRPDRHRHQLQGHQRQRLHQLQLPRPRHRRRRQPQHLLQHRQRHHPAPDTTPPTQPGTLTATAVSSRRDRPVLGRLHRQRRRHRLPVERCSGRRLHQLRPDRRPDRHRHHLQGHQRRRLHQLQLPRPRHRRRRQPQHLLQHRHRHHPAPDTTAADAAGDADRDRGPAPARST